MRRLIVLRIATWRSRTPVQGVIETTASPFALPGAAPQGIPFSLRGGEIKLIAVGFQPSNVGSYTGTVAIQRTDGGQPELSVRLSGEGIRRR